MQLSFHLRTSGRVQKATKSQFPLLWSTSLIPTPVQLLSPLVILLSYEEKRTKKGERGHIFYTSGLLLDKVLKASPCSKRLERVNLRSHACSAYNLQPPPEAREYPGGGVRETLQQRCSLHPGHWAHCFARSRTYPVS